MADPTDQEILDIDCEAACRRIMDKGELLPVLEGITRSNLLVVLPMLHLMGQISPNQFDSVARIVAVAYDLVRYTIVSEVWLAETREGDTRPPSEREDRREGLMVIAVSRTSKMMRAYVIEREPGGTVKEPGKIIGLTKHGQDFTDDDFSSWLTEFLPPLGPIPESVQGMAKGVLTQMGIGMEFIPLQPAGTA